jgi:GNAT superfamily N-acetyltransferase
MHVRFFAPEDIESTADLLHEMSVHYNGESASSRETVRTNLISSILGPNSGVRVVVAAEGAQIVGMAAISMLYPAPKEQAQLFMKELYVLSTKRGVGIGETIMHWLARFAIDNRCIRFDWTVDQSNAEATRFYRELGATLVTDKLYFRFAGESLRMFADHGERSDA